MRTLPMLALSLALLLTSPVLAPAGVTFDVVASSATTNTNGLEFSPAGGDLVVTNTLTRRSGDTVTPLYLDFGVGYDRTDAAGSVFYRPRNDVYQLYILTQMLSSVTLPRSTVVADAILVGPSEAFALGNGIYDYQATLLGRAVPGASGPLDTPGTVDLVFDTRLELGHQVLSGTVSFGEPVPGGTVPEPTSAVLLVVGGLVGLAWRMGRRINRGIKSHA